MLTMQDLQGKNIAGALKNMTVKSGTSKDGNPYTYLELTYINDWRQRVFLNDDQRFAFLNACELYKSNITGDKPASDEEKSKSPF